MTEEIVAPAEAAEEIVPIEELTGEETAVEPVEPVAEPEPEPAPQKPKKSAQQRINDITRQKHDALRDAEYWKSKALAGTAPAQETPASTRPDRDNYEDRRTYEDDLLTWHDNRTNAQRTEQATQTAQTKAQETWDERSEKIREEHPDFDDVLASEVYSETMNNALFVSEDGPELAYWLGRHENYAEAKRISGLSPQEQMLEMGKLIPKIKLQKTTKAAPTPPEPITPVGATGGAPPVDDSKLSTNDWFKKREAERKAKLERVLTHG